ncbi:putative poly-beta-hydroxybutyrate polymerase (Poly(3-hydroxybutyrate) polymerase)(PHB/PHA polymerase)(PHB/PHA synthase)(Poly(3-hydroxyalkanoate) polymerase)(Polyhydroxyalkanoic acid synthase) [Bradyrhizobium sp. STM 3843]|uniref:PHA/PHB synthase family protein n=1 Tax=Bradyrhizobium sp. STM 3843 TaxID=551947 RepID=UPI000240A835|nr:alpha/beta fold hydrolase [Bradyrhizobium sp. STM 3843]CCE04166.1 putative poly-beta-hydroxybutyrate polymerase (Poly(3-hydroxybutyrate) polymerase)(PHB/PHA polymerase)(PHB/PHA synthase)(Poly(3-hydroxyalkanoate) polymerase)(Polyhydroxyalkanoic acid synthase) [Bradyrhizobium sp. STM 3843]
MLVKPIVALSKADAPAVPHALAPREAAERPLLTEAQPKVGRSQELGHEDHELDKAFTATLARLTGGLSPIALSMAYFDWASHLATAPQRQIEIFRDAMRFSTQLAQRALHSAAPERKPWDLIKPQPTDHRFVKPEWEIEPFNFLAQAFLLGEQWWHNATTDVRGVAPANEAIVEFSVRQTLDMFAPSNFAGTNPEVLQKTFQSGGENFVFGCQHWCSDLLQLLASSKPGTGNAEFIVGKTVAASPGKIIYRNELIELIQYSPTTEKVRPEPILIVPAWIMKYYILDLSAHNSMVRYLTAQGFTVFMISWRNPSAGDRDVAFDDYRTLGVKAALDMIGLIMPRRHVHALGYCLGGTLLSITSAAMARDGDRRLKSITLLAAQTDFTEAGELTLFINESQVAFLEDMMWERGYLDTTQMAGAFQLLRSNDLIWSRVSRDYLMGERAHPSDLMAWNADATRLPARMHSEYLRKLFLHNDLAEGRYMVDGRSISLSDIHTPMFVVGTIRDHVAPWRSTYKIHYEVDADVTFVLASGGHNAGVVAPPSEPGHFYQVKTKLADAPYLGPDEWQKTAARIEGSWWPEWVGWLNSRSGEPCEPPSMGVPGTSNQLPDAPGDYVHL